MDTKLIEELMKYSSDEKTENIYTDKFGDLRSNNLKIYFDLMHKLNPQFIIVGKAPGYKGCRNTGIPFTDEFHMIKGNGVTHILGENLGYKSINCDSNLEKESSASIVWGQIGKDLDQILLWNIFPFHPFKGSKDTNRKPTKKESEAGIRYLEIILNEYKTINKIIAVGRVAEATILNSSMFQSYNTEYVRHPANGGQRKFVEGIRQIINGNNKEVSSIIKTT